jgi:hypothetical protein
MSLSICATVKKSQFILTDGISSHEMVPVCRPNEKLFKYYLSELNSQYSQAQQQNKQTSVTSVDKIRNLVLVSVNFITFQRASKRQQQIFRVSYLFFTFFTHLWGTLLTKLSV